MPRAAFLSGVGKRVGCFSGTSAAAPHAAGVIALLKEGRTKFLGLSTSHQEARQILQSTALDMESPGYDVSSGAGFIQADKALMSFAMPQMNILMI